MSSSSGRPLLARARRSRVLRVLPVAAALQAAIVLPAAHALVHALEAAGPGPDGARPGALPRWPSRRHGDRAVGDHHGDGRHGHPHPPGVEEPGHEHRARVAHPGAPGHAHAPQGPRPHPHEHGAPGRDSRSPFDHAGRSAEHLAAALQIAPLVAALPAPARVAAPAPRAAPVGVTPSTPDRPNQARAPPVGPA